MAPKRSSKSLKVSHSSAPQAPHSSSATKKGAEPKHANDLKRKRSRVSEGEPSKAIRRSSRRATKATATIPATKVLKYLLSDEGLRYCQPSVENETENASADADQPSLRLYTSHATRLNPFEELMSAAILSRPISHRLGHRTIRTTLNEPYVLTSAKAIRAAGREKVSQAVWDAKTQHKEKTAQEIWDLAATVLSEYAEGDEEGRTLECLRRKSEKGKAREEEELQKIKGIGRTGLDIFFRRIQWLWQEVYPFVDDRTAEALKSLGLPSAAQELDAFLEEHSSSDADRRKVFVIVLERAVGTSLEKNTDALLQAASS